MSGTTEPAAASASNVANTTTSSTTLGTATSTQSSSFASETKSILRSPKLGQPRKTTSINQSVSTQSGDSVVPSSDNFGQTTTPTASGISKNAVTSSTTHGKVINPSVIGTVTENVTTSTSASLGGRYVQKPSCGFSPPAFGHQSIPVGQTSSSNQYVPGLAEINSLDNIFRGPGGKPSKEKANANVFRSIQSGGSDVSNPGFGSDTNSSNSIGQTSSSNQSVSRPTGYNPFEEKPNTNVFKSGVSDVTNPGHDGSPMGSIPKFGGGATFGGNPVGGSTFGTPQQSSNTIGGFEKYAASSYNFGNLAQSSNTPIFGLTAQQSAGFSSSTQEQTGSDGSTQEQTKSGFGSDTNSSNSFRPEFTQYRSNRIIEQTPSSNQSVSRPTGYNPFEEKPNANVFKPTQSGVSDVTNPGHDRSPMGSIHKFGGGATFGGNPVGGSTFGTPQQSSNTSGGFEKSADLCPTFGNLALSSNTTTFASTAQQSAGFGSSAQEQTGSDGSTQEQTKSDFGSDTNSSYGSGPEFTEYRS